MATSTIPKYVYISPPPNNAGAKTITVDISQYKNGNASTGGFAFLVAARSWAGTGFEQVGALYLVSGIQNGLYQSCIAIKRENTSYSPTITLSSDTLTITFINTGGGYYTIIPLFNII